MGENIRRRTWFYSNSKVAKSNKYLDHYHRFVIKIFSPGRPRDKTRCIIEACGNNVPGRTAVNPWSSQTLCQIEIKAFLDSTSGMRVFALNVLASDMHMCSERWTLALGVMKNKICWVNLEIDGFTDRSITHDELTVVARLFDPRF